MVSPHLYKPLHKSDSDILSFHPSLYNVLPIVNVALPVEYCMRGTTFLHIPHQGEENTMTEGELVFFTFSSKLVSVISITIPSFNYMPQVMKANLLSLKLLEVIAREKLSKNFLKKIGIPAIKEFGV